MGNGKSAMGNGQSAMGSPIPVAASGRWRRGGEMPDHRITRSPDHRTARQLIPDVLGNQLGGRWRGSAERDAAGRGGSRFAAATRVIGAAPAALKRGAAPQGSYARCPHAKSLQEIQLYWLVQACRVSIRACLRQVEDGMPSAKKSLPKYISAGFRRR